MDMEELAKLVEAADEGKILNVSLYLCASKSITLELYTKYITDSLKNNYRALLFMEVLLRYGNIMVVIDKLDDDLLNHIIDVVISEKIKQINLERWVSNHKIFGEFYINQKIDMKKLKTYEKFNTKTLVDELFHDFKYIIDEGDVSNTLNTASRLKYFKTKLVEMDLSGKLDN